MDDGGITREEKHREYGLIAKSAGISVILTLLILWLIITLAPQSAFDTLSDVRGAIREDTPRLTADLGVRADGDESIPDVVELAAPAVVSVVISADVPIVERYFDDFSPFDFFGGIPMPQERQLGIERREIGGGTGFFVSPDGYIVTNRHVVDIDGASYSILTNDGESYEATVAAKDPMLDIAILKVNTNEEFPFLTFGDMDSVRLGSTVIAIGNVLAEFPNSVSVGVISGLSRDIIAGDNLGLVESLEGVIQTDAAINQGNSGGPLLNLDGEVIGMNVAVAGNSENIGFALPAESVEKAVASVQEYGEIVRPFLGIRYVEVSPLVKEEFDLETETGILIIEGVADNEPGVVPDSAADKAGLVEGDIILRVDGVTLDEGNSLPGLLREHNVGDTITLRVLRDDEEEEITLTLEKAPSE